MDGFNPRYINVTIGTTIINLPNCPTVCFHKVYIQQKIMKIMRKKIKTNKQMK